MFKTMRHIPPYLAVECEPGVSAMPQNTGVLLLCRIS